MTNLFPKKQEEKVIEEVKIELLECGHYNEGDEEKELEGSLGNGGGDGGGYKERGRGTRACLSLS